MEHAARLVHPQALHGGGGVASGWCDHQHALEHLGQVAQVEGVVALGGGGQQLLLQWQRDTNGRLLVGVGSSSSCRDPRLQGRCSEGTW
eukprot:scaffold284948_cov17-Tisochrysis_lutea.AAC.1